MKKYLAALATALLTLGMVVGLQSSASAHTGSVDGTPYCNDDGSWGVVWTFTASNVPDGVEGEVKAMTTSAGSLDKNPGGGVMSGSQVMLSAWQEHAGNWPGVPTRTGNWSDQFSTVNIPAATGAVSTMVQYDFKGANSGDPTKTVTKPEDCEPEYELKEESETRTREDAPDCEDKMVTVYTEERSRTEESEGVWGPWSEWAVTDTDTRQATEEECPTEPPTTEPPVTEPPVVEPPVEEPPVVQPPVKSPPVKQPPATPGVPTIIDAGI